MLSTNPETVEAASPGTPAQPNFRGRWWIRIALFVLHIAVLGAGFLFTPAQYAFDFGYSYGSVLVLSSIFLWCLLIVAQTRRGIFVFCGLVLVQAGLVALVGLQFRAEDRVLQSIGEGITIKRSEWASQLQQFRMDPLSEMTLGKRKLSITQLQELKVRARDGKAQVDIVEADVIRSRAEMERRISAVSARAADNFRRGVESSRPLYAKEMELTRDYFTECEQLAGFLIDREGQYSQTPKGLRFKKAEDVQRFNDQINAIALLQKQLASLVDQLLKLQ